MDNSNSSLEGDFILMGFSDWPQLKHVFLIFISIFYLLTIFGNSTIITVSRVDRRLQTPMYFFLANLSFLDLCYITSTVPQLLVSISGIDMTISYAGCMTQFFTVLLLGGTECVLLMVMAFDRYAAVCHPLQYTSIMHPFLCQALAISSWVGGLVNSLAQTGLIMTIPLCGHYLNHFFCEMLALLKLACGDTEGIEDDLFLAGAIILVCPVALILGTYVHIAHAVLKIKSRTGQRKALGTCGSHLMVVFLFYGSAMYTYLQPVHRYSEHEGKLVALFYTIVTPMLNPLIYTLRNKDMKGALWKVLGRGTATG